MKFGHDVRLMPPAYVKAYLRRQKNDAADTAAFCEAVTRPSMRFVPVRSVEDQAALMYHKVRELLVAQRTQLLNALRSPKSGSSPPNSMPRSGRAIRPFWPRQGG